MSIVVEGNTNLAVCCDLADFLPAQARAVSGRIFINNNSAICNLASTGTDDEKAAALSAACGTTTFTTQSQIDAFDFANIVARNIVIGPSSGADAITNISRLSAITSLLSLTITGNQELQSISGLSNLTRIGGELSINNNGALETMGDLSTLTSIGGYLNIYNNEKLQSLSYFPALKSIGGYLNIFNNGALETMGDLSALTSIGGFLNIRDNAELQSLGDLSALTSIGTGIANVPSEDGLVGNVSIVIEVNPNLAVCCDLADFLPAASGRIFINDNSAGCNFPSTGTDAEKAAAFVAACTITFTTQTQINDFDFATATDKNVVIGPSLSSGDPITNLSRLSAITSLFSLTIAGNEELQSISGCFLI